MKAEQEHLGYHFNFRNYHSHLLRKLCFTRHTLEADENSPWCVWRATKLLCSTALGERLVEGFHFPGTCQHGTGAWMNASVFPSSANTPSPSRVLPKMQKKLWGRAIHQVDKQFKTQKMQAEMALTYNPTQETRYKGSLSTDLSVLAAVPPTPLSLCQFWKKIKKEVLFMLPEYSGTAYYCCCCCCCCFTHLFVWHVLRAYNLDATDYIPARMINHLASP